MASPPPRYNVLTEDDSELEGKMDPLEPTLQLRPTRRRSPIPSVLIAILTLVVFIFIGLLVDSRKELHRARTELEGVRRGQCPTTIREPVASLVENEAPHEYPGSEGGHGLFDAYGLFPEFGFENRMFGLSKEYEEADEKSNEAWEIYQTIGGPFLTIDHAQHRGLPASARLGHDPTESQLYGVSALHQLHCLSILRELYLAQKNGIEPRFTETHPMHCFNYLREGIMCAGDTTLEPGNRRYDHASNHTIFYWDGRGISHQCRDWTHIAAVLSERRLTGKADLRML